MIVVETVTGFKFGIDVLQVLNLVVNFDIMKGLLVLSLVLYVALVIKVSKLFLLI